jgi:heme-degrading monooxygenase HmoA
MYRSMTAPSRRNVVIGGLAGGLGLVAPVVPSHGRNRRVEVEATISTKDTVTTLVNVFTVEPAHQLDLIDLLKAGTESFFSKLPGFVSSSVLNGKDGRQVVNYSQWKSVADIAAFRRDPRFDPYIRSLLAIAKAESVECEVAYVRHA